MKPVISTSLNFVDVMSPNPLDELQPIIEDPIVDLPVSIPVSSNLQEVTVLLDEKGESPTSLLGSGPTLLTPQGKKLFPFIV